MLAFKCNQLYWHCTPAAGFHDLLFYGATAHVFVVSAKQTPWNRIYDRCRKGKRGFAARQSGHKDRLFPRLVNSPNLCAIEGNAEINLSESRSGPDSSLIILISFGSVTGPLQKSGSSDSILLLHLLLLHPINEEAHVTKESK